MSSGVLGIRAEWRQKGVSDSKWKRSVLRMDNEHKYYVISDFYHWGPWPLHRHTYFLTNDICESWIQSKMPQAESWEHGPDSEDSFAGVPRRGPGHLPHWQTCACFKIHSRLSWDQLTYQFFWYSDLPYTETFLVPSCLSSSGFKLGERRKTFRGRLLTTVFCPNEEVELWFSSLSVSSSPASAAWTARFLLPRAKCIY